MDQIIPSNIPNLHLLCRLCLCEDVYMFPIFNETNIYLPQRIAACVNVEVYNTDNISTLICKQCFKKINDWHEFKRYCNEAQSKLNYWSNLYATNDTVDKSTYINIKEEIINCDEEEIIISDSVEDIKVESIEANYQDFSCNDEYTPNEETDPVSTTMYFSRDDETCLNEPEAETLLIPTHELAPDAHGLINPAKPQQQQKPTNTNGIVDLKISQVYQIISCRICNVTFSSTSLRSKHEKREHMVYFKENKCCACNLIWNDESELIEHYRLKHSVKLENKVIQNSFAYNTVEESYEYLKGFAENLISLRNNIPGAKRVTLDSFEYYNQCVQKIIDRNSRDSDTCLENVLDHLLERNVIIKNSCHQCCISFKNVTEYKQHISKRYCKKRLRLVESGEMKPNQHFKCVQCDRIFGCTLILTQHIKLEHVTERTPDGCRTCHKNFHNKHEYNAHVQETCSYLIYCSICDKLFNTTDQFKIHCDEHKEIEFSITKTEPETIYNIKKKSEWNTRCCFCPKVYQYYNKLNYHFKTCHPQFQVKTCPYCGDIFLSDSELERHKHHLHYVESSDHRSNAQMYYCGDCNSVFRTIGELEQHKTIHSDSNSNMNEFSDSSSSLTCTICVQTFNFEEELKQHIITKHKNGKIEQIRFRCTSCKVDFSSNKSLVQHDTLKHSIAMKTKSVRCTKCKKTYKNLKSLKYHKKYHCVPHPSKSKMIKMKTEVVDESYNDSYHECFVCKKMFISKRNLISHSKVHFPFKKMDGLPCRLCHKIFETVEELLEHLKCHPSKSLDNYFNLPAASTSKVTIKQEMDQESHVCEICGKDFTTKFGLTMHTVMKHSKRALDNRSLGTRCVVCAKQFPSTKNLIVHVHEHIVRKHNFICKLCNKLFAVDAYHTHMSKVHEVHLCIHCNKSFSSFGSLCGHRSSHSYNRAK